MVSAERLSSFNHTSKTINHHHHHHHHHQQQQQQQHHHRSPFSCSTFFISAKDLVASFSLFHTRSLFLFIRFNSYVSQFLLFSSYLFKLLLCSNKGSIWFFFLVCSSFRVQIFPPLHCLSFSKFFKFLFSASFLFLGSFTDFFVKLLVLLTVTSLNPTMVDSGGISVLVILLSCRCC